MIRGRVWWCGPGTDDGHGVREGGVSIMKLPSGRWRAQVHDPAFGHNVSVSRILGGPGTFATKTEAKRARESTRTLGYRPRKGRDCPRLLGAVDNRPLFARPKESAIFAVAS